MKLFTSTRVEDGAVSGYPVSGRITSYFGVVDSAHPIAHTGLDIAAPSGTPIYSPAAGLVLDVFAIGVGSDVWEETFGNSVIIRYEDYVCLFAHMQDPPPLREGWAIGAGQLLGHVGSTGQSTGAHLHWGMAPRSNRYFSRDIPLLNPLDFAGETNVEKATRLIREALAALEA